MKFPVLQILFLFSMVSCASTTVNFQSSADAVLVSKGFGEFNDKGEILKLNTPIEAQKLQGKMVQVNFKGIPHYYWVFFNPKGPSSVLRVEPSKDIQPPTSDDKKSGAPEKGDMMEAKQVDQLLRLVFGSSKALQQKDSALAEDLATKASELAPRLATPIILRGLSEMQKGDRGRALSLFTQAQALSPEDKDLKQLIELVK